MKIIVGLILTVVIAILAVIFAFQNSTVIGLSFLAYRFDASIAFIVLMSFAFGLVAGLLAVLPSLVILKFKLGMTNRKLNKNKDKNEEKKDDSRRLNDDDSLARSERSKS